MAQDESGCLLQIDDDVYFDAVDVAVASEQDFGKNLFVVFGNSLLLWLMPSVLMR